MTEQECINDMDAFKELMTRLPKLELMNLEQLHATVFWSGAAAKWARLQIDMAKQVGGMQAQMDAWIREAQIAGELEMRGQQRLGKIAKDEPKANSKPYENSDGEREFSIRQPSGELPKWKRLGFKSEGAMEQAELLEQNPEEVDEVIEEAKKDNDLPSKGAVRSKIAYKKEKARREKAEREGRTEATALEASADERVY